VKERPVARIVIIDDSLLIRTLLSEILTEAGHEVVATASDGLSAPSIVQEHMPDLVTLDLVMPGRDGLVTLKHLLIHDALLPVVVCSASLDQRRVVQALRLGARGFVVKPFTRGTVLAAVDEALTNGVDLARGLCSRRPGPAPEPEALDDLREFTRVRVALPVVVETTDGGTRFETVTVDLSGGGMLLAGGPLTLDVTVRVRLELQSDDAPVEAVARVVRFTDGGQPALAFEHIPLGDHERLTTRLQDLQTI
jgi:two-component system, chemotaxis family, chemotaxis protein CheY